MINKVNNNQLSEILKDLSAKQAGGGAALSGPKADASLQVSYDAVIEQARQMPASDVDAVERARQLLASGQLDSPENIRKAAENIATYGVYAKQTQKRLKTPALYQNSAGAFLLYLSVEIPKIFLHLKT